MGGFVYVYDYFVSCILLIGDFAKKYWDRNHGKGIDCVPDLGIRLCSLQSVAVI